MNFPHYIGECKLTQQRYHGQPPGLAVECRWTLSTTRLAEVGDLELGCLYTTLTVVEKVECTVLRLIITLTVRYDVVLAALFGDGHSQRLVFRSRSLCSDDTRGIFLQWQRLARSSSVPIG